MKRKKDNLTVCTALALSFALLPSPALLAQPQSAAVVRVAIARMETLSPVTLVPGTVVSRNDARLSAEVEGRLVTVTDVGEKVAAGDVVATIEDASLRLYNRELQAEIGRAQAKLSFLEGELTRFAKLAESNLAAVNQLDQTRSERDVALSDLEVARARLAQNEDQLARTRIKAPFGGIVVERLMTPGERVTEGTPVVRLVDQDRLEVIARAPLEYFQFVERGERLDLRTGTQTAIGQVRTMVAVGDENTHQFELRLDLDGRPFVVGQTLRVSIPTSDARDVLAVPRDALVLRAEGQSVFVIDENNQARQIPVTTGVGSGEQIEVLGAVAPGDRVVIRGNERLQPGQTVTIMDS